MSAKTANVLVRIEPEVKLQAEKVMEQLGVPASVVINMLYKQIILTKSIPFSITLAKEPLVRSAMTKEMFDKMMGLGYADAIGGRYEYVDKVFDAIDERISAHG